jgi:hypothetical protein
VRDPRRQSRLQHRQTLHCSTDLMPYSYHVRPFDHNSIAWSTSRHRYYRDAEMFLEELIEVADQVVKAWPPGLPDIAQLEREHPHLHRLCRRRDRLSNAAMMFAAIAIEAFINFYGVYRLGERQFTRHVERLPIQRKLELLLLICDGVELEETEPVLKALKVVTVLVVEPVPRTGGSGLFEVQK